MKTEKHRYLVQQWSVMIQKRIDSGKTVKLWCYENGIRERKYYYWLAQIRKENYEAAAESLCNSDPGSAPARMMQRKETGTFVELRRPDERAADTAELPVRSGMEVCPCILIRACGMEIGVCGDTPEFFLRELIRVLKDA